MHTIAHFSNTFFVKSETFIYHYLSHMKHTRSICLAWNLENLDYFSFPKEDIYSLQLPKFSPRWFYHGIRKKLTGRNVHFESIVKKRNAGLIHAHFGHNGVQALALKKHLDIPLVTTFYGADLSQRQMVDSLLPEYRGMFEKGDLFLVEGPHMKSVLQGLGCGPEKIKIQRIAIPVETITFKERKPKNNDTVKLLFCGRFTEKKGLMTALEAVKIARQTSNRFTFSIIGDGQMMNRVRDFIRVHNMDSYVELPGFLPYDEYLRRVEEADLFLHPSVTASDGDSEGGAPTTILEAQAMGLPIISTNHADIPNIVVPGKSALLSDERDAKQLAQNILHLLDNQDLWSPMGQTGREFVQKHHNITTEAKNLEAIYHNLTVS